MTTARTMRALTALALAGLAVGVTAESGAAAPAAAKPVTGTFVGTVAGTDAYVAVVAAKAKGGSRAVLAYVCDSQQLADWFTAKVTGNHATLTAKNGDRLRVDLTNGQARGTLRASGGADEAYAAGRARRRPAGLYQAVTKTSGKQYLGGWIALADGTQRGAIKLGTAVVANPTVTSFTTPITQLNVPGVGSFAPKFTNPIGTLNRFVNPVVSADSF